MSKALEAIIIVGMVCGAIFALAFMIIWAVLRYDDKVGPLASAERNRKIEQEKVAAILEGKEAEAKIVKADARLVEANAKLTEAQHKAIGALEVPRHDTP